MHIENYGKPIGCQLNRLHWAATEKFIGPRIQGPKRSRKHTLAVRRHPIHGGLAYSSYLMFCMCIQYEP